MLTDEEIQYKIDYEIIVDCYDDYEMSMGWYTYFDETLAFPFKATAELKKRDGSIETTVVKIVSMASDEDGFKEGDFYLDMENADYINKIAYSKLSNLKASDETMEAFEVWDFWIEKRF